jgi:pheromone shutdown protein TraB
MKMKKQTRYIAIRTILVLLLLLDTIPVSYGRQGYGHRRIGWILRSPRGGGGGEGGTDASPVITQPSSTSTPASHQKEEEDDEQSLVKNATSDSAVTEIIEQNDEDQQSLRSEDTSHVTVEPLPEWKAALPERLRVKSSRTLQKISISNIDVWLLGTAHVSNDSSIDVQILLDTVKPQCVLVELCDARVALMEGGSGNATISMETNATTNTKSNTTTTSTKMSLLERVKETQNAQGGSRLQALSTVLLTSVQEDYADILGVELGGEFRCAYRYWLQQKPHLILGDRPLQVTLLRAWESLTLWPKMKVVAGLLWSSIRKPNKEDIRKWLDEVMREETDVLTESFEELRQQFPTLYTIIISERDAWLACKLRQSCRVLSQLYPSPQRASIVAIVGAGHVPGIGLWLTDPPTDDDDLSSEDVLSELVRTRRWENDSFVNEEMIPVWVNEVTALQDNIQ